MLDFLGVTENFSAIEDIPWTQRWTFSDESTAAPVSLDGVTFAGRVYIGEQRASVELDIQKSAIAEEANILIVSCVALPEGRHPYEIYSVSESGNQNRLISGYIGVIKSIDTLVDTKDTYASRTLSVRLPGHVTRQIKLEWLSCTAAALSAGQAWEYYEKTKELSEGMEDIAELAKDAASKLAGLDDSLAELAEDVKAAQDAASEAEKWAKDASKKGEDGLTPYVGGNGNWWVGEGEQAKDLGSRAVPIDGKDGVDGEDGQDGKSPIIQYFNGDVDGTHYDGNYWYVWGTNPDTGTEEYLFTSTLAEGKNGLPGQNGQNGDAIKRIIIPSIADLPAEGSTGTLYYIPQGSTPETWAIYAWLQKPDKTHAWEPVNETDHDYTQYAQTDLGNITVSASTYGTQYPDSYYPNLSYLKMAVASGGQNIITQLGRPATAKTLGMVKLATDNVLDSGSAAPVGINSNGQLMVGAAKTNQCGAIKISSSTLLEAASASMVGINSNGQLLVPSCQANTYGSIKARNTKSIINGALLDTNASGVAITPLAGYRTYGTVCYGTNYPITLNDQPHVITVAKCDGLTTYNSQAGNIVNALCINLTQNGALRYDKEGDNGANSGNALWLALDQDSMRVNADKRLAVKGYNNIVFFDSYATALKGGSVKVGDSLTIDPEGNLDVKFGNINSSSSVRGSEISAWVHAQNYLSVASLESRGFVTKEQHDKDVAKCIQSDSIDSIVYITQEEFDRIPSKDPRTSYYII